MILKCLFKKLTPIFIILLSFFHFYLSFFYYIICYQASMFGLSYIDIPFKDSKTWS